MSSKKCKILIVDGFKQDRFDELTRYADFTVSDRIDGVRLNDKEILVVRSRTRVDKKLVDRMPNLKVVITATHGTDHIDLKYLKNKSIRFYNVPVQSYDVAQGVMAYILAHATNLVKGNQEIKKGRWKKRILEGFRVRGKTLGVIGFGRIGKEVTRLAVAMGLNVIIYDPYIKKDALGVLFVSLKRLLESSNFISIHVPLNKETVGLIGQNEIDQMKKGVFLINTARGGIVDEKILLNSLNEGKLSGVALDVYNHQPQDSGDFIDNLARSDKVISTPHSIAQTQEAMNDKEVGVIEIIKDYVRGHNGRN